MIPEVITCVIPKVGSPALVGVTSRVMTAREVTLKEWGELLRAESGEEFPADETIDTWPARYGDFPEVARRIGRVRLFRLSELNGWRRKHPAVGLGRRKGG